MLTQRFALPVAGILLLASAALAQTARPFADQTVSVPSGPTEFLTQEKAGEWRASKLKGLDVYNDDRQRLGAIKDILVDRDGKIDAVVIGVGGFLGFHEHDVALRFDQISWAEPLSGGESDAPRAAPDHAVVRITKDQLLAFPEFLYAR